MPEREASPRVRGGATTASLVALLGIIVLLIVSAYFPFHWDIPRYVRNAVTRIADGSLRFGNMNHAWTPGTPVWLHDVSTSGIIQIRLDVKPESPQQSPAPIMMLASDFWHTDFSIEQDHSSLLVWLRRPRSTANGDPPFVVGSALQPQRWNSVDVRLQRHGIRIVVDGRTRLDEHLPADSPRVWGQGQIALGDEVHGGGPWHGSVRHAEVRTSGYSVDYVRPGALAIPQRYLYFPDHIAPFPPQNQTEWFALSLHLLSFVPIGFLIVWTRRPPVRPVPATLLAMALAVVLAAGKFLFYGRHMAVADLVVQAVGALLGALLASRWAHRQYRTGRMPHTRRDYPPESVLR